MSTSWRSLLDPELQQMKEQCDGSPSHLLSLAKAYNGRCRRDEALKTLDALLAQDRSNDEAWFERIIATGESASIDDIEALNQDLEAVLDERPQDAAPRRNLGYLRLIQGLPDDAEPLLRQALELNGQDPKALELMGLLSLHRDHVPDAKAWFLKALTLQPQDSRTLRMLGITEEQLGDLKGAEAQFSAALAANPHYFWGWHSLGEFLLQQNQMENGLLCIHEARSIQTAEPSSYFILAELFAELGHLEMAQAELHKLLALAPTAAISSEAYSILGELRRDQGDVEGAISYFSLATEMDPEASAPWAAMGDLAREGERFEDALRCYREALARNPEAADVQIQLGYVYLKMGRSQESEKSFLAALESDPGEYSAYLGLAEYYRQLQRPNDQMAMVKQAMTLAPEDPDVWNAQGVALEVAGQTSEATASYEKALSIAPAHRKAVNNLGFNLERRMLAGEAGMKERAVDAWKRRLLLCRDEGQSLKMATEHLTKLGIPEETIERWINQELAPEK
ncbi:MAG TPA: tetratricopeptide repeat protein [Holophaga sp.]|jgi:tetratricopeptide (TPR) repeat protein|nr:tetratricopeptide repeat protein [Holophaga sp.]